MKTVASVLGLLILTLLSSTSHAQEHSDVVINETSFIESTMQEAYESTDTWKKNWMYTFAGITILQAYIAPMVPEDDRIDLYYGLASSGIGLLGFYFLPSAALTNYPKLRKILHSNLPFEEQSQMASALWVDTREGQIKERGWPIHMQNVLFNSAVSLPLGIFHDRWPSTWISLGAGVALGEAVIFTQPNNLTKTYKKPSVRVRFYPRISRSFQGVLLGARF